MTDNLYTVEEFSDIIGMTSVHVYRLCKKKLQPFVTDLNGQIMLSADALTMFNKVETSNNKNDNMSQRELIDALQTTIDILTEQIRIKDAQLKAADERLHESNSISMSSLNLSERQQQLYLAAIAEPETEADEPVREDPKPPVKNHWWRKKWISISLLYGIS